MNLIGFLSKFLKKSRFSSVSNSKIHKTSKIESGSNLDNVAMDKHSFCGYDCEISNTKIGSFCSIANNVVIGGGMHPIDWVSTSPVFYKGRDSVKTKFSEFNRVDVKKTYIGHDVWIGQNVLIKQGVTIGNGAVIGMGSVVTKNVPNYAIYAGNPAKLIRMRFDKNLSDKLNNSRWWNIDEKSLKKYSSNIKNPRDFVEYITNLNE